MADNAPVQPSRRVTITAALLAVLLYALIDVGAAHALKHHLQPTWNPTQSERRYRIWDSTYNHTLKPGVSLRAIWGGTVYPYRTNSLGMRDARPRVVALHRHGPRLLLMGDSFTEGLGVRFERTFAGILSDRLAPCGVEVLNAGVSSYSPIIYWLKTRDLLQRVGLQVSDMLVLIDDSDITDEAKVYYLTPQQTVRYRTPGKPEGEVARIEDFVTDHSVTAHLVEELIAAAHRGREHASIDSLQHQRIAWSLDPDSLAGYGLKGERLAQQYMDSLLALTQRNGIHLTIAIYPWPEQVLRGSLDSPQRTLWHGWADRHSVPIIDMFPDFIDGTSPQANVARLYTAGDVHWNASGHLTAANALGDLGLCGATGRSAPPPPRSH